MKPKVKRRNICLPLKTDELLEKLNKETENSYSNLIKQGLELLAEKKGIKK